MPETLRPYRREDLDALLDLFHDSVHGLGAGAYDPAQRAAWAPDEADRAGWAARLDGLRVRVAEDPPTLLGFVAWTDAGYLDLLYVAPAAARRGVATRLYAAAEAALVARGVARIETDASDVARPFFARQGFTWIRENRVERRGQVLRNHRMAKALQ